MRLDVTFSIQSDFLLLLCDIAVNAAKGGSAHTEHIAASVPKAASASIYFHIWICLGDGGIPSLLDSRCQSPALPQQTEVYSAWLVVEYNTKQRFSLLAQDDK